jgi:precorrin-6B C5,15-methyltransferase / cobalt-precorrin-6B C5,C15-methyltransferase
MSVWLDIIGLDETGLETLGADLRRAIASAELIVGGKRHLALLGPVPARTLSWATPLSETIAEILRWRGRRVVVLATGDPMHFGIGVTLARRVAKDEMAIHPGHSAFSLAAARLGWPLDEIACLTAHGRPLAGIARAFAPGQKILVLSHDRATPCALAADLARRGFGASDLWVLEHMGGAKERISHFTAANFRANFRDGEIADLNTLAILCRAAPGAFVPSLGAGLPDSVFRNDGQLTKREMRAATLSALAPLPGELLWDVGAGCGSIAIEWLRQHKSLRAIAIERVDMRLDFIRTNATELGVPDLEIVAGVAPEALAGLASPDAVFIGGGIGSPGLIDAAWAGLKPGGRLVANVVTAEGEAVMLGAHARMGGEITRISVQRLEPVGGQHGWKSLMPVTQWKVVKP